MSEEATIMFDGKEVKPKKGFYYCPFRCGDPLYPRKKWKTERGFRKHMESCSACPSAQTRNEQAKKERDADNEKRKQAAMADCPYKIGDTICYVREIITAPTHRHNGLRMVRVRYEAEKRFVADSATVESFGFDYGLFINDGIRLTNICVDMAEATAKAEKKTKDYREHCEFAARCR